MYKKVLYKENNKKTLGEYGEINFIFNSNLQILREDESKYIAIYQLTSMEDFYSLIDKNEEILKTNYNYVFKAVSDEDLESMLHAYQLLSFTLFHKLSAERLSAKMEKFNQRICTQMEGHVAENISEFVRMNGNGKFIRGTLVNLGYNILDSESIEYSDELALAFEIFQTAILIHDDVIDHATLRRNEPTIPSHYIDRWISKGIRRGEMIQDTANAMAICSGDIGMYFANQKVVEAYSNFKDLGTILQYFNRAVIKTIQGEIIDIILPFEEQFLVSGEEELIDSITEIYRLKTAWYTVIGPLCLGAILAGGAEQIVEELEVFAESLGIAFQIKDDILGIYANQNDLGKNIGSDITEFKQTLLYAYARKQDRYLSHLLQYYGKKNLTSDDMKIVQDLFFKSGALKYAEQEMDMYFQRAVESLEKMKFIPEDRKNELFGLIWYLKLRKH